MILFERHSVRVILRALTHTPYQKLTRHQPAARGYINYIYSKTVPLEYD